VSVPSRTGPHPDAVLDLHAYLGEFEPFGLKQLAAGWEADGVGWIVGVGDDPTTSEAAIDASWSLRNTVAGVGLHPRCLPAEGASTAAEIEDLAAIAELATDPQVAVITDVGVDEAAPAPIALQEDAFRFLLDVAATTSRSALVRWKAPASRLIEVWDSVSRKPRAALLDFEGSTAEAEALLGRGLYFSLSPQAVGIGTSAAVNTEVLRAVPAERLFVHSDARSSSDNGSAPPVVATIVERLAEYRGVEPTELATQINANLWQFLTWRPK
jgi:Tat protein secretion system quality control protein TatD with DNase activity